MTAQLKRTSMIYGIGAVIYICGVILTQQMTVTDWVKFFLFFTAYLFIGFDTFRKQSDKLMQKRVFTEYTFIILATVGAFGIGRYIEGVLVMLLFELGVIFETFASDSAKRSIAEMTNIRPAYATLKTADGEVQVDPGELMLSHIIVIKPGERIPVDALVLHGATTIDTKALTGEAAPQWARPGDRIYSGCINLSGVIEARVVKVYEDSTVSKIMNMVDEAQNRKAESETFVSRFSRVYTAAMLLLSAFIMVYPPLSFSYGNWNTWIYRGLIFMVVASPGAIVMSVPIAFLGGIACAAKHGILVKGGNYLEDLAKSDIFVFDKTGTLTQGVFEVKRVKAVGMLERDLLKIAAHVECYSNHPIAQSLFEAYTGAINKDKVYRVRETPGYGVSATYEGQRVHVGNWRLMEKEKVEIEEPDTSGSVVYVAIGNTYVGHIVISDEIREDAYDTLDYLKNRCNGVLVMLTGDSEDAGRETAEELDMDYAYSDLMPLEKVEQLEEFLFVQDSSEKLVFVGDGINDAPVLARADVGVAVGELASAAAVEAADVVLISGELTKLKDVIRIAKETVKVVNQNIMFAMGIKAMVLLMAGIGYFGMWEAILAEVGVMIASIMNAAWTAKYTV
ncbi:MAG: cadmium-translocating P-type ATPase [Dorea sp.]|jgi:Cd2+/Zn2+-exporting ATPase|nr:cadmium-translocating P-type ATPase [Dorea sp.]